jgi:acylphosphatase
MDDIVRRYLVTGKVQGVFFRHSARLEAKRLQIRGLARNLADGSVEVLAQGSIPAV